MSSARRSSATALGTAIFHHLTHCLPPGHFVTFNIYAPLERYEIYNTRHYYTHLASVIIFENRQIKLLFPLFTSRRYRNLIRGLLADFQDQKSKP